MPTTNMLENAERYLHRLCLEISNRRVGSAGNREATAFFSDITSAHGFKTEFQEFSCIDWIEKGARLITGDDEFEVFVSPYSLSADVRAPLIQATTIEELETVQAAGKILLLRGELAKEQLMPKAFPFYNPDHHQHIVSTLERISPLAIITATTRNPELAGGMYPFPLIEDGDFDIPSVYMTDEEGHRLLDYVGKPIHLESHANRIPASGCNVIARRGDVSNSRIVLTAHIDSKDNTPGALDNATGVVILLLLAELMQDYEGDLGIELVAINGEDYFSAIGEVLYLDLNRNSLDEIILNVNMDGVGFNHGKTAFSFYECSDDVKDLVSQSFSSHSDLIEGDIWYSGDHMIFVQNGVSAVALTSEHGMAGLAKVSHTPDDVPKLVDLSKLVSSAFALQDLLLIYEKRMHK